MANIKLPSTQDLPSFDMSHHHEFLTPDFYVPVRVQAATVGDDTDYFITQGR